MDIQARIAGWLAGGRAQLEGGMLVLRGEPAVELGEKARRAYAWIAEEAIRCPYADLEFGPAVSLGTGEAGLRVHGEDAWASFIVLPLLTLLTSRRLLFIGAPGRGKTTMATLMALLAGEGLEEARRGIQHGHPQLTIADLLGGPLPSALIRAEEASSIRVSWRGWLRRRVKIVDEYNRIPTRTQSALLSLMAEGYAELYEQVIEAGRSAWFLTANDEQGGGTFPVIEALRDRIDVVVRCAPFHARYLDDLVTRIEGSSTPEAFVPGELVFSAAELDAIDQAIRAIPIPAEVREAMGFFMGQLDFCRRASTEVEFMNKDTLHLAKRRVGHVCTEDCPLDKNENLCAQTENGVSARAYQTWAHYSKAMAWFRGRKAVSLEEVRQLAPWVLHERLEANAHSAFFQRPEREVLLVDRVGWIRHLFDAAVDQQAAWAVARAPGLAAAAEAEAALESPGSDLAAAAQGVRRALDDLLRKHELNGPVHADVVALKGLIYRLQQAQRARRQGRGW